MTVLMKTHTSGGHTRVCNAACYNAKGPVCECICGGANHSKGLEQAQRNMQEHGAELLARAAEHQPHPIHRRRLRSLAGQLTLF
jgi:hypothetical protein